MVTKPKGTPGPKRRPKLSKKWRDDAEETLLAFQSAFRALVAADKPIAFEMIAAYRAVGETLTVSQAVVQDEPVDAP